MRLRTVLAAAVVSLSAAGVSAQVDTGHYFLMTYFKNLYPPQNDMAGVFFATSTDGMNWVELNGGAPIIAGSPITEKLCRDPMTYYDASTMTFHVIYTTGWTTKEIGYTSLLAADGKNFKDQKNWTAQIPMHVSDSIPNAICTWAPEIFWDDIQNKYMIYWSTDAGGIGKRAYYVFTTDFKTYTKPVKFFDPGFTEIDGTILKVADGNYYFIFKDERDAGKTLFYVTGPTPQGPWSAITGPITSAILAGVEGPTAHKYGSEYRVYFDPYSTRASYRMVKSTDLVTWTDGLMIKAGGANFYFSHCNIIELPKNIYDWINTTKLSVKQNCRPLSPIYSSGTHFEVPGVYDILGKKVIPGFSWPGQNAAMLPAGFHITVDKNKRVVKDLQTKK
jgi:hypothetical protein